MSGVEDVVGADQFVRENAVADFARKVFCTRARELTCGGSIYAVFDRDPMGGAIVGDIKTLGSACDT